MPQDLSPDESKELIPLEEESPKSQKIAFTLGCFGGFLGLHRFYTGRVWSGLAMMMTFGGLMMWWIVDFFVLLSGRFKDSQHRVLGRPRAIEKSELQQVPPEQIDQLPNEFQQAARQLDDDHLLEDPLEGEFEQLEQSFDGDTEGPAGADGRP